jgi:nucleoside-diphosphate-sugar epimerase
MSRVLVTGAGGYIGSQAVDYLARHGHEVTGIWRSDRRRLDDAQNDKVRLAQIDLADAQAVERLVAAGAFDAIVHAAAAVNSAENADQLRTDAADNVQATANLLAATLKAGCRRFLYCSTISVYGGASAQAGGYREAEARPVSIYGWSKLAGEQVLNLASRLDPQFSAVSLRLAGVHGRGRTNGALHAIASEARNGNPIVLKEPETRFRWLLIDDLLAAFDALLAAPLPPGHHVCNLASADDYTLAELAERIRALCGSESPIEATGTAKRNEVMNIERAVALWGYKPTRLEAFLPGYLSSLPAAA